MKIFAGCILVLLGTMGYATAATAAEEMAAASAVSATSAPAATSKPAPAPSTSAPKAAPAPTAETSKPATATETHVTHAPAKVPKMLKLEAGKPRPKNLDLRHCLNLKDNKAIAKCAGE